MIIITTPRGGEILIRLPAPAVTVFYGLLSDHRKRRVPTADSVTIFNRPSGAIFITPKTKRLHCTCHPERDVPDIRGVNVTIPTIKNRLFIFKTATVRPGVEYVPPTIRPFLLLFSVHLPSVG
jgi:hypothetical protein